MSGKTVILTGTATVTFRKVMRDMDAEDIAQLEHDSSVQEFQIDFEDCTDLVEVLNVEMKVAP